MVFSTSAVAVACATANKAAVRQASAESARSFAAGDYGAAIELQRALYKKEPDSVKVLAGYVATVEETKKAADQALAQGSYPTADGAYRALLDNWDGFSAFSTELSFEKADAEVGLRECRVALCEQQFRDQLRAGAYAKALATYQSTLREYPGDKILKAGYAMGFGDIRAMGARALDAKEYAIAGKIYRLLLRNFASFEAATGAEGQGVPVRKELEDRLRACTVGLTNLGLAEYRKGNLEKAVAVWTDLLAFDPDNAAIQKAVETAKAQSEKLKGEAAVSREKKGVRVSR
jgi:tetratricopeptide (TPR) repeat protein